VIVLTWLGRVAAFVVGLVTALASALLATLLAASASTEPAVFLTVGLAVGLGTWVLVWLALRQSAALGSRPVAGAGALVVLGLLASALVPLEDAVGAAGLPPGAGVWRTPDGGRLAHGVVRAAEATGAPVVLLHGGPGIPDTAQLLEVYGPLAVLGHDVWAYEQRGAGRSSRLADPSGYGVELDVADLELVRQRIGAERMILVGHSYGAYLASAYIAEHPERVERAVLTSPGDLDPARAAGSPLDRLSPSQGWEVYRELLSPRALLTYALVQVNPAAARALAGDKEVDARQDRVVSAASPGLHCPGAPEREIRGTGFYANTVRSAWRRPPDPDLRERLGHPDIPVLVITGECDYLDRRAAAGYLTAYPDSRLLHLPGAGHDLYLDQPEAVRAAVSDFLRGRPVRGVLDEPSRPPANDRP